MADLQTTCTGPDRITMVVTVRERDTILAALRYWQREGMLSDGWERDIANNDHDSPLTAAEIDAFCEDRLNLEVSSFGRPRVGRPSVLTRGGHHD